MGHVQSYIRIKTYFSIHKELNRFWPDYEKMSPKAAPTRKKHKINGPHVI